MEIIFAIAALILLIILAVKFTGKAIKIIIMFIFVGFVIYLVAGTEVLNNILSFLGVPLKETSDMLGIR